MKEPTFIPDGYSRPFRIKAHQGMHGELCGVLRPFSVLEREDILSSIDQNKGRPAAYNAYIAKKMASRILSWDCTDPDGKDVPITAESILKLQARLHDRLYGILMSRDAGDPLEGDGEQQSDGADLLADQLERSLQEGRSLAEIQAEDERKNSSTAAA